MTTEKAIKNAATAPFQSAALEAARRWKALDRESSRRELFDPTARRDAHVYDNNIESYIGTARIPLGIAGPVLVHGRTGSTAYDVPMATSEAALVASYNRGARLLTDAGGCTARVVAQSVSRTPMFAFSGLPEAQAFAGFAAQAMHGLAAAVSEVTAHGRLIGMEAVIEGNHVYLDLRFHTGDAAGQNMVTFAAEAICTALLERAPQQPRYWFLEANFSGDKKASSRQLGSVRGKRAVAEIVVPEPLVRKQLHTSPRRMVDYWYGGAIGGVLSGTTGIQGHYANGLAAVYLACGQDVACVAESATGVTRLETDAKGDLYASVTLPNLIVGTVGGGTGLPSARACLELLGLAGSGNSEAFAELCAATVLAGELSIIGAFCSGDFATAHRALSRGDSMPGRERQ